MARRDDRGRDKVAIVTGGASGIGRAIGEELAARGADVVLADRQIDLAGEVAKELREGGLKATASELDVRDAKKFAALVEATVERAGRVDYLFNNAGIGIGGEIASYSLQDWDDVIDVNLRGVTNGIQAVYPVMIRQGSGHIVNTASVAGLVPTAMTGSYTATKHAVVGLSRSLRIEGKRHGVRASALCPGAIRTPILTGGKFGKMNFSATDDAILGLWANARPMPAEDLARGAIEGMLRNEAVIVLPKWWKALWYMQRLSPTVMEMVGVRAAEHLRKKLGL